MPTNNRHDTLSYLLNKHRDLAFKIALNFVKNVDDAEDLVQESFIKVFLYFDGFRNDSTFSTWLYKVIYNEALKFLKKKKFTYLLKTILIN